LKSNRLDIPVSEIMNTDFESLDESMPLTEAYNRILASEQSIFPVYSGGKITGIIDLQNISEFGMIRQAESVFNPGKKSTAH
jgi:signal-transduction protein with cAMP-binding, CBS, and nucleotidyltransferase domain